MPRSSVQNWFATELASDVGSESLVFDVTTTGNLSAPAYIVIRPRDEANREVILCDVAFTDTRFETSALANRHLAGSAKSSGQTHPSGSEVWSVPLAQHLDDLWDSLEPRLRVIEHGATAATTRPSDADTVLWVGSAEPSNAVENDIWIDTDGGYRYLVHDGSSFVDPIDNATTRLWIGATDFFVGGHSTSKGVAGGRYPAWLHSDSTEESVLGSAFIPDHWTTAHVDVYWTNAGTGSGGVAWSVPNASAGEGDPLNADHSTGTEVAETAPSQNVLAITRARTDMTVFPSEVQHFRPTRSPANGGDTLPNDAAFLGIMLTKAS